MTVLPVGGPLIERPHGILALGGGPDIYSLSPKGDQVGYRLAVGMVESREEHLDELE